MKERFGHYDSVNDRYHITLRANSNTLKSVLDIGRNYKVDFIAASSLRIILGFNEKIYSEGYNESDNIVNILSVTSLIVTSDIIGSSFTNGDTKNIIYSFFSKSRPGLQNSARAVKLDIPSSHIKHNFSYGD